MGSSQLSTFWGGQGVFDQLVQRLELLGLPIPRVFMLIVMGVVRLRNYMYPNTLATGHHLRINYSKV